MKIIKDTGYENRFIISNDSCINQSIEIVVHEIDELQIGYYLNFYDDYDENAISDFVALLNLLMANLKLSCLIIDLNTSELNFEDYRMGCKLDDFTIEIKDYISSNGSKMQIIKITKNEHTAKN